MSNTARKYLSYSKILIPAGKGYCKYCVTHIRPRSSKYMFNGCATAGSCATTCMASPSAIFNFLMPSSGVDGFDPSVNAPRPLKFSTKGLSESPNFSFGLSAAAKENAIVRKKTAINRCIRRL